MLVVNVGRLSPANEMSLVVLLESMVRRSIVVVFKILGVLLSELACIIMGDGPTPDAVEDFFIRGWIIGDISLSRGDNVGQGRGNVTLCRRDLLLRVGCVEGLFALSDGIIGCLLKQQLALPSLFDVSKV
jgi:hypothetical protein